MDLTVTFCPAPENYGYKIQRVDMEGQPIIDAIAEKHNIPVVCKLPIDPSVAAKCDRGMAEEYEGEWLDPMIDFLEKMD